jgi:hypothetical protein
MQDQSSKSVVCLPTREGAKRLLLHFGSCDGGKPKGREQRQGEAGGGGTEQVGVEVGVASSEERRVCEGGLALTRLGEEGRSGRRGRADVFSRLTKGPQR